MYRKATLPIVAVTVAALLAACSGGSGGTSNGGNAGTPVRGGTLVAASAGAPSTVDGRTTTQSNVHRPWQHVMEGLFALDANDEPQPMLADSFEMNDAATELTVKLRDVSFNNGDPLTAADVVASIEAWSEVAPSGRLLARVLTGVRALDDRTVTLTFAEPSGLAPVLLADPQAAILPARIATETTTRKFTPEDLVGTGPYKVVQWDPTDAVILERNDAYAARTEPASGRAGEKTAYLDRIEFRAVPDASARLAGLQAGQYGWAEQLPADDFERLRDAPDIQEFLTPNGYLAMQFNNAGAPTDNRDFRLAMQQALDLDEMAPVMGPAELWKLDHNLLTSKSAYNTPTGKDKYNVGDLDLARASLARSGYAGQPVTVVTLSAAFPTGHNFLLAAVDRWKQIGIAVTLRDVELAVSQQLRDQPDGWNVILGRHTAYPTPLANPFLPCNRKGAGRYCSPAMDTALAAFFAAADADARLAAYDQVQKVYWDDVPFIKGPEMVDFGGLAPAVHGYQADLAPSVFWNVWMS